MKRNWQVFFADLDQKINGTVTDHEAELANFFAGLGPVVNIAKRAQAELDRTAATKFSVFNYFKQAATNRIREIHLSRVFGGLLDPVGAHGQGDRFLRLLLAEVHLEDFLRLCLQKSKVHLEHPTDKGRMIDIALEIPDTRWIGIENKPWAEEGEKQVKHYLEYLQNKDANAWMLYLSGNGSHPESLQGYGNTNYLTVPYRADGSESPSVENWIRRCQEVCEAERVRWFLKDLLEYIQRSFNCQTTSDTEEGR